MDIRRRQFFRVSSAGLIGSSIVALGFSPTAALAEARNFKLARTTETRNTCPYCSVGCGLIMYSLGDRAKNVVSDIVHIEGDPDHPVNRGTLCPKGAGLLAGFEFLLGFQRNCQLARRCRHINFSRRDRARDRTQATESSTDL